MVAVIDCDFVCPSITLPKLKLAGEIDRPACAPVPLNATCKGELDASLLIVIVPVILPTVVGANEAVIVALCDVLSVMGVVTPLEVMPAPVLVMLEILTAAFPVFVKTICFCTELPIATDPKLTVVEFAFNCPVAAVVPLPLNATVVVGLVGSLLVIVKLPVELPAAVGEKVTVPCMD